MPDLRIGISGWIYKGWRGEFYPEGLPHRRELEYATRVLNSLEINGTFYSLKSPATFDRWAEAAPEDFVFAVKGPRFLTHTLRLRDVRTALANFFANGVLRLGENLGPFLWQLPPRMDFEPQHVAAFCDLLPKNTHQAVKLARRHNAQVAGRASFETKGRRRLRHAFEIRDERFMNEDFVRILRRHGHALVFADSAGKYPYAEEITSGFIYIRLHGAKELYASGYTDEELEWWTRRMRRWSKGEEIKSAPRITDRRAPPRKPRDVYVYFDNDAKVHAPFDAISLAQRLGVATDPRNVRGADGEPVPPPPRLARGT